MVHIPGTYATKDLVMLFMCLGEPISVIAWRIGFIDANTIGCVALEVVLYLFRLHFRCYCHSFRHGSRVPMVPFVEIGEPLRDTYEQRMQHPAKSEDWSSNIYRPAPSQYCPKAGKDNLQKR